MAKMKHTLLIGEKKSSKKISQLDNFYVDLHFKCMCVLWYLNSVDSVYSVNSIVLKLYDTVQILGK